MKIKKIVLAEISIPMKRSLSTAQAVRRRSNNIILKLEFDNGIMGYGESVPRSYVTGENNDSVFANLRERFAPRLLGFEPGGLDDLRRKMAELEEAVKQDSGIFPGAALCMVDLALLDAWGKSLGRPLSALLGGQVREKIPYTLGMDLSGNSHFEQQLGLLQGYNLKNFKVKVGNSRDEDLSLLKKIRERFGPDLEIRVDANCKWETREAIETIWLMERYGISCVEQPIRQGKIRELKQIKDSVSPLIIADESACSLAQVKGLLEKSACDLINVKISKCGGLLASLRIAEYARGRGVKCMLGAQAAETGILEAAGRLFATITRNLRYFEGSVSPFIFEQDIVKEDLSFDRDCLALPLPGAGLGISLDEDLLQRFELRSLELE